MGFRIKKQIAIISEMEIDLLLMIGHNMNIRGATLHIAGIQTNFTNMLTFKAPSQEALKTKAISSMRTGSIFSLVGIPVVISGIRYLPFIAFEQFLWSHIRIEPPTISPTPGIRRSTDSVSRGSVSGLSSIKRL